MASFDSPDSDIEVKLDGIPIELPPERRSFAAIRSYLESLALSRQRLLCWIALDGEPVSLTQAGVAMKEFTRLEGETMTLGEVPAQLIRGALFQASALRTKVQSAVELILINESEFGRELWWTLATALKEPLMTLSLVPDTVLGSNSSGVSLSQLRKWQLQQVGRVIQAVDQAASGEDPAELSDALEQCVLPWLDRLQQTLELWHETASLNPHCAGPAALK